MSSARHHAEWLSLIEVSGPFLSLPVLLRVFPQGLDGHDPEHFLQLRTAYEEWLDNQGGVRPDVALHREWLKFVLRESLDWPDAQLREGQALPPGLAVLVSEHHETLRPDFALLNPPDRENGKARVLVHLYPATQKLDHVVPDRQWKADPATRMMELLKATGVALGLVTNGEHWMLVHRPAGEGATSYASWYANLWTDEQLTLRAFRSLLGQHRLFGVEDADSLEALFAESAQNQQEVTDQLGYQVRKAVEVLVQALDRQDRASGRQLLAEITEKQIYEAALTVMMRLVFLFSAEERGLLLLGDPLYDQYYAVSTLRAQLREDADSFGEEVLEYRHDAWCRLLATFRALYGGITHERLRSPAYGGSLFNPDRFPFLEGRAQSTTWRKNPARPLPINNRTVLHLLEALQILQVKVPGGGPAEARRLSFRALDIEQIGHVYEGLLDHTAVRATEPVLGIKGPKDKEEEIALTTLEEWLARGEAEFARSLCKLTKRQEKSVLKALQDSTIGDERKLRASCENNAELLARVRPFSALLREDTNGYPVVIPAGSIFVSRGEDRRSSGTHYTPRSLTEPIVQYTLEPLVYLGPAEGTPREGWTLKSARDILKLKVCDMAMGSGAFLVQACRYLSERLVEAWAESEGQAGGRLVVTPEGDLSSGDPHERPLPKDDEERLAIARRIVAAQCLYGVDINPMAVEMAKLSLWLVTLAKGKPFTFLDHALKCGDSLLGVDMAQLKSWSLDPKVEGTPDYMVMEILTAALKLREELEHLPADGGIEIEEAKESLHLQAENMLHGLHIAGDLILSTAFERESNDHKLRAQELQDAFYKFYKDPSQGTSIYAAAGLLPHRQTFHWPLEFPEVFLSVVTDAFDAIIGNPPFRASRYLSADFGTSYLKFLHTPPYFLNGQADICAAFCMRAFNLIGRAGFCGFITTKTISEGDTRRAFLTPAINIGGSLLWVRRIVWWPGKAQVVVSLFVIAKSTSHKRSLLDGKEIPAIDDTFSPVSVTLPSPNPLMLSQCIVGKGVGLGSDYFRIDPSAGSYLRAHDNIHIRRYITGINHNSARDGWGGEMVFWFEDIETDDALESLQIYKDFYDRVPHSALSGRYWRYRRGAGKLYQMIDSLKYCIIRAQTSSTWTFTLWPKDDLFDQSIIVFCSNCNGLLSVLCSSIHEVWVMEYGGMMKTDTGYSPSECFYKYPLPYNPCICEHAGLARTASNIVNIKETALSSLSIGNTDLYWKIQSSDNMQEDILQQREMQITTDYAVMDAYGWNDIDLCHGFHETKQGIRFTISENARREVLDRLLRLNHERYAEEVAAGLHEKGVNKAKAKGKRAKSINNNQVRLDL